MSEIVFPSTKAGNEVDRAVTAALTTIPGQITQIDTRVTALEEDVDDLSGLPAQVTQIGLNLGDLANLQTTDKSSLVAAVNEVKANASMSIEVKQALMNCFANVAWANEDGQLYYRALYNALFGATPAVTSISAVFSSGGATIYTDDALDSLRQYITVTAHYADSTRAIVTDYTLSGTLVEGTSTLSVTYSGISTSVTINNVVDFYNIFSWSTEFSEVGKLTKNRAIYDNDTYTPRRGFRTANDTKRFGVCVDRGKQPSYSTATSSYTSEYPVPIPKTATKVTISVTPSTDYVFGYIGQYAAGGEGGYDYTMVNESASWTYQGTYTCTFTAGENLFLGYNGKKSNGGAYSAADREARVVTITFE